VTDAEFQAVFDENKDAVYRFVWRMARSPAAAEDITQDVFVALLRSPDRFDPARATLRAFLLGIARNLVLKHWRTDDRFDPLDDDEIAEPFDPGRGDIAEMVVAVGTASTWATSRRPEPAPGTSAPASGEQRASGERARYKLTGPLEGFHAVLVELNFRPGISSPEHRHPGSSSATSSTGRSEPPSTTRRTRSWRRAAHSSSPSVRCTRHSALRARKRRRAPWRSWSSRPAVQRQSPNDVYVREGEP
jgi:RNA polymerase sigma factor (sigma-70 family)